MPSGELNNRSRKILSALVSEYIATGEPVGSRTISRKYDLQLSPASIRNVMSDLEELGYIRAPHTSAGRVPTAMGLRYFVDCLLKVRDLSSADKDRIALAYDPINREGLELATVMQITSRLLSELSRHAGVILAPRLETAEFEHIEFVRLSGDQVLAILVTSTGMVQNRLLKLSDPPPQHELDQAANYLNDVLSGLTLCEVREKVLVEMGQAKNDYDRLVGRALSLGAAVIGSSTDRPEAGELYIEGKANLLDEPAFDDLEKMKALLRVFEEKSRIIRLLDSTMEAKGIQIFLGAETPYMEMEDCAMVVASYGSSDRTLGTLGVIGPTRMNYSRVIPLVDCTARIISGVLDRGL